MTRKHYLLVSDFDQTLSFNDSGLILSEMLGISGFEEKTANFIARDWDAFRYDLETGVKILPRPPMLITDLGSSFLPRPQRATSIWWMPWLPRSPLP